MGMHVLWELVSLAFLYLNIFIPLSFVTPFFLSVFFVFSFALSLARSSLHYLSIWKCIEDYAAHKL